MTSEDINKTIQERKHLFIQKSKNLLMVLRRAASSQTECNNVLLTRVIVTECAFLTIRSIKFNVDVDVLCFFVFF